MDTIKYFEKLSCLLKREDVFAPVFAPNTSRVFDDYYYYIPEDFKSGRIVKTKKISSPEEGLSVQRQRQSNYFYVVPIEAEQSSESDEFESRIDDFEDEKAIIFLGGGVFEAQGTSFAAGVESKLDSVKNYDKKSGFMIRNFIFKK